MLQRRHWRICWIATGGLVLLALFMITGCSRSNRNDEILVTVTDEGGGEARKAQTPAELLALAKAEGELNWFTSITASQANSFAKLFEAKYPGVTVRLVRGGTFDLAERIQRDLNQGRPQADVLHVLDPAIFVLLRQRGELYYYESPTATAVSPEYKDPGYWTAARLVTLGLAYDSKRLKPAAAPKTWGALLNSRRFGKLGLKDAQTAGSAYAQYYFLREKYGVSYWEQIAQLKPRVYKTEEDLLDALSDGEIQIAAGIMVGRLPQRSGAHLVGVWPQDGVPLIVGPVGILSRAPHPNAAKLFENFVLSKEGQEALRDLLGAYSARTDVAAPKGWPRLDDLHLLRPDSGWGEYLDKQSALRAEYSSIFHSESE